jgi:transcriptional regulator with XRE-family HTH domain
MTKDIETIFKSAARASPDPQLLRPGLALRGFRTEQGLTLAEVSQRTGLTVSTLSKIENGKMELTVDKLIRISLALEVNVADIFGSPRGQFTSGEKARRRSITRASEGQAIRSKNGEYRYQAFDLLSKEMTPMIAEVEARSIEEFGEFHRHPGEEYVHVLEGRLAFYSDTYAPAYLDAGDSIYFDSDMGHAYVKASDERCRILSVFSTLDSRVLQLVESREAR